MREIRAQVQGNPTEELSDGYLLIFLANWGGLFVDPDVLPSGAVKYAVRVDHLVLDPGPAAVAAIGVEDDWPNVFLGQFVLDLPEDLLPPRRVAFDRLLLDQLVDLFVAVPVPVDARAAAVKQIEDRVGIRATGLQVKAVGELCR